MTDAISGVTAAQAANSTTVPMEAVIGSDPVTNAFQSFTKSELLAQNRPVDPTPPGRAVTISPDERGTAIGGGLGLLIRIANGAQRALEYNEAKTALRENLTAAIDDLENAPPGSFVEIRSQYRPLANGNNLFVDMYRSVPQPVERLGGEQIRATLPAGVEEHVTRIHNIPNANLAADPSAATLERARSDLERLNR